MSKRYVYKKIFVINLITLIDLIGTAILKVKNYFISKKVHTLKVKKILILKLDHAGDVLLATPVIRAIREVFPQAYITLVIGPWSADILKKNKNIDNIICYKAYRHDRDPEKRINMGDIFNIVKRLRKENFDLAFDLRGDIFAILISFLAGIPRRIGYGWEGGGFLLTDEVKTSFNKHQTEILLDALTPIKKKPLDRHFPDIIISNEDNKVANEILQTDGWNSRTPLIGFHLGAGYPIKIWDTNRYGKLMNLITREYNAQVLIVGGSEDKIIYENIKRILNFTPINVIGETSFSETAALIKQCNLFIGNDSVPVHIAASIGTPTIVIFSAANDDIRWAPLGNKVTVFRKDVSCRGCEKNICDNDMKCMKLITVDEVFEKVKKLLIT